MILRSIRLGNGRIALAKPSTSFLTHTFRRYASLERQKQPDFVQLSPERRVVPAGTKRVVEVHDPDDPVARDYLFFQHQKERTSDLGAAVTPHFKPHELVSNPPWPRDITLELLMASQSHLGHATSLWNPANAAYIFGIRGDHDPIHIISLDVTAAHLRRACKVVSGVAERGGLILFVGTRDQQSSAVVRAAQLAKGCHLFTKWIPGSITNGQQILGRCAKKVVNEFDEEVPGFEDQLLDKAAIKPDLVVCLNPLENYVLLHECGLNSIPTIGIIDTDANPTWVTYPIPANDDSLRCVQLIAGVLGRAGQEGQRKRLAMAQEGVVSFSATHQLKSPARVPPPRTKQQQRQLPAVAPAIMEDAKPVQAEDIELGASESVDLPHDLDGVPVDQFAADEALLQEAERAAYLADEEELEIPTSVDQDTEFLYDAPLSSATSAEAAQAARDFEAQFLRDDVPPSLEGNYHASSPPGLADEPQSPLDQVESVEEELSVPENAEDAPPQGTPERALDEEPPVTPKSEPPSEGETDNGARRSEK